VRGGVLLEEMVLASVSGELELGADADYGAGGLGSHNGLLDVPEVGVEVHRPLVQVARGNPQKPHLAAQIKKSPAPLLLLQKVGVPDHQ
jgi:hypothetical protein